MRQWMWVTCVGHRTNCGGPLARTIALKRVRRVRAVCSVSLRTQVTLVWAGSPCHGCVCFQGWGWLKRWPVLFQCCYQAVGTPWLADDLLITPTLPFSSPVHCMTCRSSRLDGWLVWMGRKPEIQRQLVLEKVGEGPMESTWGLSGVDPTKTPSSKWALLPSAPQASPQQAAPGILVRPVFAAMNRPPQAAPSG